MNWTLSSALEQLKSKAISPVELAKHFLQQRQAMKHLNAFITEVDEDIVLNMARESEKRWQNGTARALEGIPIAHKDLYCTEGLRTTAGSRILENFVPPYESTVSLNLKEAGTVVLGKLNMDEFAMGSTNTNSAYGPVINPWKGVDGIDCVPGGSSGGSAAAVAARMCLGATASDTGGSIRQPAAFCGVTGLKPTYGLCSRWGMVAFASSLDQAGPITHTVKDAAYMLQSMAGYDPMDATSANVKLPDYTDIKTNIQGMRIGVVKEYIENLSGDMLALFQKGVKWMTDAGATIHEISLKSTTAALPVYYVIAPAEASSNLARYDGVRYGVRATDIHNIDELYRKSRSESLGWEVKRRIMIGTYVLSSGYYDAYYNQAQKVRRSIRRDFEKAFEQVDVILTPTAPSEAFGLKEIPTDPVQIYLQDIYTVTVNLAELPAISVPAGFSSRGMPLGLQLIAPHFMEQRLLSVGSVLEEASQFHTTADKMRAA